MQKQQAETRLAEEDARIHHYLHISTETPLITRCETVLIKHHTLLIQDEFEALISSDKMEDLTRMYKLLVRVPEGLDKLREAFEEYVKKQGLAAVDKVVEVCAEGAGAGAGGEDGDEDAGSKSTAAPKKKEKGSSDVDPKTYVEALLAVHQKYSGIVSSCFSGDPGFVASMDKAVREFLNRNAVCKTSSSKSPELLAKFCDSLLRKSNKGSEDSEVEELLNNVVCVFLRACVTGNMKVDTSSIDDCVQVR
jgi:cullin 1